MLHETTHPLRKLAAAAAASLLLVTGCSGGAGDQQATQTAEADHADVTDDAQLRQMLPAKDQLTDPRQLTGVTAVSRMNEVQPVTDNPQPQLPVQLTDADGFDVEVTDVSRILALDLFGTYTKVLAGLGLKDNIVGRTVSSDEQSLKDLPVVTPGGHTINTEAVLALEPTLVIVDHSIGPDNAISQIRDAGVTVVVMEPQHSLDAIGDDISNVAAVVGLPDEGTRLAERSLNDLELDRKAVNALIPGEPLKAAFLYARGNGGVFYILGEGSGAKDLIEGVGAVDLAAENKLKKASPANAESLALLNPDVFFMMTDGLESTGGINGLLKRPGVAQTTAGKNKRVITIPDGQALAFGPETGEMLLRTAMALYDPQNKELQ